MRVAALAFWFADSIAARIAIDHSWRRQCLPSGLAIKGASGCLPRAWAAKNSAAAFAQSDGPSLKYRGAPRAMPKRETTVRLIEVGDGRHG